MSEKSEQLKQQMIDLFTEVSEDARIYKFRAVELERENNKLKDELAHYEKLYNKIDKERIEWRDSYWSLMKKAIKYLKSHRSKSLQYKSS